MQPLRIVIGLEIELRVTAIDDIGVKHEHSRGESPIEESAHES